MRCDEVRALWAEEKGKPLREALAEHLASCAECAAWRQHWLMLRAGFEVLAREAGPEPMLGFRERLLRRLEEAGKSRQAEEFLERAGRRVVWATLALALTVLLALALPPGGPVRSPETAELSLLEPKPPSPTEGSLSVLDLEGNSAAPGGSPRGAGSIRK